MPLLNKVWPCSPACCGVCAPFKSTSPSCAHLCACARIRRAEEALSAALIIRRWALNVGRSAFASDHGSRITDHGSRITVYFLLITLRSHAPGAGLIALTWQCLSHVIAPIWL